MTDSNMAREIAEQPALIEGAQARWQASAAAVRERFSGRDSIALVGRGSSGNACTYAAYLLGVATGRQPIEFRPWLASQPEKARGDWSDTVAYAYSVSGESTDITGAAQWLRERGAAIVGVTNADSADCRLGQTADELFFLGAGPEEAVPATKTFTAQLFVGAALAGLDLAAATPAVARCMRDIQDGPRGGELAGFLEGARTVTIIARGPALAAALDVALKLQETAALPAQAYSAAEFLHGPIGAMSESDRVLVFADIEDGAESLRGVRCALLGRNTPFLVVGADAASSPTTLPLPLPAERWARSPVFAFVGQLAALELARRAGLDPDAPRGLNKVTLTV